MSGKKRKPIKRPNHQIWMGDLEPQWTESSIIQIWNSLGEAPISVKIIRDKETSVPMYCFVSFSNIAGMNLALSKNGTPIIGTTKKLRLNHASGTTGPSNVAKDPKNEFTLFFEGDFTESLVFEIFNNKYPTSVRQVKIVNGHGLIKFNSSATQQIAFKEMNNIMVDGILLKLSTSQGNQVKEVDNLKSISLPNVQPPLNKFTDPNNSTIEILGLAGRFTEYEIELHFKFGDILFIQLSKDYHNATVTYRFREDAEQAILLLNHSIINGVELLVNWGNLSTVPENINKKLIKRPELPISYGVSNDFIRFDKLSPSQVQQWINNFWEPSECK